jgi:hypothetical protein
MRCTLIVVNGLLVPRKIGTGKSVSEYSAYLAAAQAYLHFPPFACHPLLATSVPFCFFNLFDPCGAMEKKQNHSPS